MKTKNQGFSLVELIIVIAIMAILVGTLVPQFLKYVEKSRKSTDASSIDAIVSAAQVAATDTKEYDSSLGALAVGKYVLTFSNQSFQSLTGADAASVAAMKKCIESSVRNLTEIKLRSKAWGTLTITFNVEEKGGFSTAYSNTGSADFAAYIRSQR